MKHKTKLIIILILILFTLLSGCSSETYYSISGKVILPPINETNFNSNDPNHTQIINYAWGGFHSIVYLDDSEYTISTLNDHQFSFKNLPKGKHKLKVLDNYFESDELIVNLTDRNLTDIQLYPKWSSLILNQTTYSNNSQKRELNILTDTLNYQVAYSTDNISFTPIPADNIIGNWVDVSTLMDIDINYYVRVSTFDSNHNFLRSFTKEVNFFEFKGLTPANGAVNAQANPTFTWTTIPGNAYYYFCFQGKVTMEQILRLINNSYTLKQSIIESSGDCNWNVTGYEVDLANNLKSQMSFMSKFKHVL